MRPLFLLLYLILFYALWFFCRFWFIPLLEQQGIPPLVVEAVVKGVVFLLPVLVYLKLSHLPVLRSLRLDLQWGIVWGVIAMLALLEILWLFAWQRVLPVASPFSLSPTQWVNDIVLVGLFEEIPFRGLLFQQLRARWGFWVAALASSILFMLMHLPQWLSEGHVPLVKYLSVVFVLGFLLCVLLQKSRSLWSCILVHSTYNFLVLLISAMPLSIPLWGR